MCGEGGGGGNTLDGTMIDLTERFFDGIAPSLCFFLLLSKIIKNDHIKILWQVA